MSDEQPITLTIPDPQAWYYAALITALLIPDLQERDPERTAHFSLRDHLTPLGADRFIFSCALGTATTTRTDDETTIVIVPAEGERDYWRVIAARIDNFAAEAKGKRWVMDGLTADELIERYYRARSQNRKITLRQIADSQRNYSYTALKQHKQRYDARGGWGSKKKRKQTDE